MRTITEILKDVDNAKSQMEIQELAAEIFENKYKYPLAQLEFAKEHIESKIGSVLKADFFEIDKITKVNIDEITFIHDKHQILQELKSAMDAITEKYKEYIITVNIKIKKDGE